MAKCIVCNKGNSQQYSALCRICSEKQKNNTWGEKNEIKKEEIKTLSKNQKTETFLEWAFSPIETHHRYRGATMRNPFPKILGPFVIILMFISALPALIIFAPFWIYFKIEALLKDKK